ncbi:MAG: hypothetical protein AUG51_20155 [Acidobacteria bacterium 13_1_20CM_3_53_8]|nr:MAG: hypothetical protein AUG51_20155 [Acidobacteria bacterium 13_1_20CM_3_53_8]
MAEDPNKIPQPPAPPPPAAPPTPPVRPADDAWYGWFTSTPFRRHMWTAIAIILLTILTGAIASWYAEYLANDWAKGLPFNDDVTAQPATSNQNSNTNSNTQNANAQNASPSPSASGNQNGQSSAEGCNCAPQVRFSKSLPSVTDEQKARLIDQYRTIGNRASHHLKLMKYFFAKYYGAISVLLIIGLIAAIALLFISKEGWSGVNPLVITIFITSTSMVALYGAFPAVFKYEDTVNNNKNLYLAYTSLAEEVLSYAATGKVAKGGDTMTPDDFIHYVDEKMSPLNLIAIGFDYSSVPNYRNIFETKPTPSPTTPSPTTSPSPPVTSNANTKPKPPVTNPAGTQNSNQPSPTPTP